MAGVKPACRQNPEWRGGRGQILLLGAFSIAVLLIVFAGVLNAAATTETLAGQVGPQPDSRDVATVQADVRRGANGIMARFNAINATYSQTADRLERSIGNWSTAIDAQYVSEVVHVTVSLTDTVEGSYISQTTVRTLTNASDVADWTLAEAVPDTRRFRLRLNNSSLVQGPCDTADCFSVVLDNGTADWTVSVNQSAVVVDGPTATGTCPIGTGVFSIDLTGGTVAGRECAPLTFGRGLPTPYDIGYRNGVSANGTYRLVVNTSVADDRDYTSSGSPSVSPAVYAATLRVVYRSPQLRFVNAIRLAPGEPDD